MSTLTKEWLQQTIAELEEERDATPGAVNEDAAMALAAMKLALASLEAEAVAYMIGGHYLMHAQDPKVDNYTSAVPLYTAPPAPVSVPEMKPVDLDEGFDEWYSEGESGADSVAPEWFSEAMKPVFLGTWRACRAAMLQGADGNSPVIPDCSCLTCRPVTFTDSRFVVCPECGNKRCPHANDHRNACTGSNEPGQEGSAYPAAPQQEVK
ncbi:hypothetical protein QM128_13855 [Enterobacter hormaechei]|uniref:hypothetical protein n=1 Tax=Enterobacter hormaechei TaxID=158836 RepID=UPI0017867092|nr:hypothetical protein [Enterobacter hormaechei]MBE0222901.1 hypothetical protein [Enterobacter hormaechei]MDV5583504.1 hypothetical protein [Enterobacter hormaechei]